MSLVTTTLLSFIKIREVAYLVKLFLTKAFEAQKLPGHRPFSQHLSCPCAESFFGQGVFANKWAPIYEASENVIIRFIVCMCPACNAVLHYKACASFPKFCCKPGMLSKILHTHRQGSADQITKPIALWAYAQTFCSVNPLLLMKPLLFAVKLHEEQRN